MSSRAVAARFVSRTTNAGRTLYVGGDERQRQNGTCDDAETAWHGRDDRRGPISRQRTHGKRNDDDDHHRPERARVGPSGARTHGRDADDRPAGELDAHRTGKKKEIARPTSLRTAAPAFARPATETRLRPDESRFRALVCRRPVPPPRRRRACAGGGRRYPTGIITVSPKSRSTSERLDSSSHASSSVAAIPRSRRPDDSVETHGLAFSRSSVSRVSPGR